MKNTAWVIPLINNICNLNNLKFKKEYIKIMKNHLPKYLYKYYSFDNEYALYNLENDIIYFSAPNTFNDPFDCVFAYDLDKDKKRLNITDIKSYDELDIILNDSGDNANQIINLMYTISCFCEKPNNLLMWSHYSDKHTGFCVEYDFSKLSFEYIFDVFPVLYTDSRIELSSLIQQKNRVALFKVGLLQKSKIWEYENEWRFILPKYITHNSQIKQDIISKIYCGANISEDNKERLITIIDAKNKIRNKSHKIDIIYYELDKLKYDIKIK